MRKRVLIAEIGYTNYIIHPDDAVQLLNIAQRAIKLEGWGPKQVSNAQEPFCRRVEYDDVEHTPKEAEAVAPAPTAPSAKEDMF